MGFKDAFVTHKVSGFKCGLDQAPDYVKELNQIGQTYHLEIEKGIPFFQEVHYLRLEKKLKQDLIAMNLWRYIPVMVIGTSGLLLIFFGIKNCELKIIRYDCRSLLGSVFI